MATRCPARTQSGLGAGTVQCAREAGHDGPHDAGYSWHDKEASHMGKTKKGGGKTKGGKPHGY